jgi:trehalose 6-phosphate phosphatase
VPAPDAPDLLLAPLLEVPRRSAVVTDFDGTLSPIVDDPAAARPLPGARGVLAGLAAAFGVVAVVSGRPAAFLAAHLAAPGIRLVGLYGMEEAVGGGRVRCHPEAERWRPALEAAAARARAGAPGGCLVEHKGLALTLHYRRSPERAAEVWAWARAEAARTGLSVHAARMSVELRPPVECDKGTAVGRLIEGMAAACFVGDDAGDLAAFDALDRLAAAGGHAVRVAVASSEAPATLLARADLVLEGPEAVLALLRRLGDRAAGAG